jgi:hypothetical protein
MNVYDKVDTAIGQASRISCPYRARLGLVLKEIEVTETPQKEA